MSTISSLNIGRVLYLHHHQMMSFAGISGSLALPFQQQDAILKKTSLFAIAFGAMIAAGSVASANAATNPYAAPTSGDAPQAQAPAKIVTFDHKPHWRLGTEIFQLSEHSGDNSARSPALGLLLGYDLPVGHLDYVKFDGAAALMSTDFSGATDSKRVSGNRYNVAIAYDHQFDESLWYTRAGVGLQYRTVRHAGDDTLENSTRRALWLNFTLERDFSLSDTWRLTPQVGVGVLLHSKVTSSDVSATQRHGVSGELALAFAHPMGGYDLTVTPYVRHEKIRAVDAVEQTHSNEFGVRVSWAF